MGELIDSKQAEALIVESLEIDPHAVTSKILECLQLRPTVEDGVLKWWKHDVERALGLTN